MGCQWWKPCKHQHTTRSNAVCIDCGRGKHSEFGAVECKNCEIGRAYRRPVHLAGSQSRQYNDENNKIDAKCKDCPMGYAAPDPFKACSTCEKGKYQEETCKTLSL